MWRQQLPQRTNKFKVVNKVAKMMPFLQMLLVRVPLVVKTTLFFQTLFVPDYDKGRRKLFCHEL